MNTKINIFLVPALYIVAGLIIGLLSERIVLRKVLLMSQKTKWRSDDVLFSSLPGLVIFWCILIGIFLASKDLDHPSVYEWFDPAMSTAAILSLSLFAARIVNGFISVNSPSSGPVNPANSIVKNIVRITFFTIGGVIVLQSLGISVSPILTALGVGGLAVALALQGTLSNLFSGIQVIASKQIRQGDYIQLDSGEEGFVEDISWKNTSLKMLSNNIVIVPNTKISSAILTNFNLPAKEMSILVRVGVSYDSDLDSVERITIQTARDVLARTEGGVGTFEPFIRYHTFADSSIEFTVVLRVREFISQYLIKHEFIKALQRSYRQNNIEIPFPIRTVLMKKNL